MGRRWEAGPARFGAPAWGASALLFGVLTALNPAMAQSSGEPAVAPKAAEDSAQTSQSQTQQSQTSQSQPARKAPLSSRTSGKPATPASAAHNVVTVTAPPEEAVRTSIDRRSYSVATDLQGSGGSLADALRNIPGAEVDLNGNLSLRGGPVRIMIDGQPSAMFGGQSAGQVLQSMPADRIDRVEVITTPTAAFSPEGQAGIINLVTKKSAPAGASGGMRANVGGAGRKNVAGNWAYTKGKLTVAADGGWRRDLQHYTAASTGTAADAVTGLPDSRAQQFSSKGLIDSWNGHLGFNYQIDPKTQLSGDTRYFTFKFDRDHDNSLLSSAPNGTPLEDFSQAGRIDTWQNIASGQMTLLHQFPGKDHTLSLFYNHTQIHYTNDNALTDVTTVPGPTTSAFQDQFQRSGRDVNQFKADYTRPMPGEAQLKVGYDLRVVNAQYSNYELLGPDPPLAAPDPSQSNLFRYHQMVNAAYTTYERSFGAWTVLAGLRVEDEQLQLGEITQAVNASRDNLNLFPSLHLAYKVSATTQWVLSYASRIERPEPFQLDPFRSQASPFDISAGNPTLTPQTTQSFEGGWQYRKGPASYLATLFYRQSEHGFTSVTTNLGGGVLLTQQENLANSKTAGLELVAAAPLFKTLTYNVSADLYWKQIQAPVQGVTLQTWQDVTASGHVNINWQPTKTDLVQGHLQANAASVTPTGHTDPLFFLTLGYRHKFTDNFALVTTVVDPLDSIRQTAYLDSPGLDTRTVTRPHIQTAYIGFTWTFGGHGRAQRDQDIDIDPAATALPEQ